MTQDPYERPACLVCRTRLAAEGCLICNTCSDEVRDALDEIVRLYPEVAEVAVDDPDAGWPTTSPTTGRGSPGYRSMPPLNLDRLDRNDNALRYDVVDTLAWWAGHVRESTGLPRNGQPTVTGEVKVLQQMWPWIRRQQPVGDFARDVQRLRDALRRATGTRRIRVGRCPTAVTDRDQAGAPVRCGQILYARLGQRLVKCGRCGTPWPAYRWEDLAKAQETA